MERKQFLELCQKNSVYPASVTVCVDGVEYYPIEYRLCFDEKGKTVHKAVLRDKRANSFVNCDLERVRENEK